MAPEMQTGLVKEIAALFTEYRDDPKDFVKFGMKCGLALNTVPLAAMIMFGPKQKDEHFRIADPIALKKHGGSETKAFNAAFDQFTGNAAFLAWNGIKPPGRVDLVRELSENFAHPTMTVEMTYRRRGDSAESRLNMFFIGFKDEESAQAYGKKQAVLLK